MGVVAGWSGNIMAEPAMKGKVEQKNIDALMANIFTSDFYDFQSDYNSKVEANNSANPTYETKIDNSSVNWECTD